MPDIALSTAQRTSLITLRNIETLSGRTQERLTTGRKINSVVDDAVGYFQSKGLSDRARDYDSKKANIDQGVSVMQTTLDAIEALEKLLKQMKGIAEAAKSQSAEERATSTVQFLEIGNQVSYLVEDASYQGLNLLNRTNNKVDISFSENTTSRLIFNGFNLNATSAGAEKALFSTAAYNSQLVMRDFSIVIGWDEFADAAEINFEDEQTLGFSLIGELNTAVNIANRAVFILDTALTNIRAHAAEVGANVGILQARLSFTYDYVTDLESGSDKLTIADINEEGANMVALQTRQEIGLQALKVSGDQQQAILRLLQ